MRKETYNFFIISLLVGFIHSSQQHGTKGGLKSFSHSYSSSSSSAHSSSFSSSGSYSSGDKSVLPIIGPIPIAKAAAVASASAGASTAVAGASSVAGHTNNVAGTSSVGISGTGSYAANTNSQGTSAQSGLYQNANKETNHYDQKIPSTGFINGEYSGASGYGPSQEGGYGGSKISAQIPSSGYGQTHTGSGSYGASNINSQISSTGGTYGSHATHIVQEEKETEGSGILKKPPCCKPIPPGPNGSIHDYKVPSGVNTIGQTSSAISGYGQASTGSRTYGVSKPFTQVSPSGYGQSNVGSGTSNVGSQVSSTGYAQTTTGSGSYGGVIQSSQGIGGGTNGQKPCCKGPFPGPNGSIYDSKPASAVGTEVKVTGTQEPIKPSIPLHRPTVDFPGPSGSIYTSKPANPIGTPGTYKPSQVAVQPISNSPGFSDNLYTNKPVGSHQPSPVSGFPVREPVGGYQPSGSVLPSAPSVSSNTILKPAEGYRPTGLPSISGTPSTEPLGGGINQYGYQSNANAAASGSTNSYQTQYQGSSEYKPSCSQGLCNKEPPRTYLQPPQGQIKPIIETVREQPIPQGTPGAGYNGVKPQIPTSVTVGTTKPGSYGFQVSSINNGYNTDKVSSVSGSGASGHVVSGSGNIKPQGPGYSQIQPDQVGIQRQEGSGGYQGGISASSTTAGSSSSSSTYSATGGVTGIHKTYNQGAIQQPTVPSFTIIDDSQSDQDRILFVSSPGSTGYTSGKSSGFSSSVTENTIAGSGLHEGPRGPFIPKGRPEYGSKRSDYDDSEGFIDGQEKLSSGSYSSGRGYSSSTGFAYSGSGVGGHAKNTNIYSVSKIDSPNKDLSYSKTPVEIENKPTGTYTSTLYVDLTNAGKPGQQTVVSQPGTTGQGIVLVGTSASGDAKLNGGSYNFYGSSSIGHNGIPCNSNGCGTSYRQYSNAVPSSGTKNVAIHITSIPTGAGSSYSSSGSYGGGSHGYGSVYAGKNGGGYGSSQVSLGSTKGGSAAGSYGSSSASSGNGAGSGGFLSTIFLGNGAAAHSGSHSGAGGYSHATSFSKASSHASSSSFSSASSGSYSSSHY